MISIILIFLARVFKAFSDKVKSSWGDTIFSTWEPDTKFKKWFIIWAGPGSQIRKWKRDENGNKIPNKTRYWYYAFIYVPKFKEEFVFSSTFLVSIRDAWHTSERFRRTAYALAVVFFSVYAAGWQMPGIQIPNIVNMLLGRWLEIYAWFPLTSRIVSAVSLVTFAQLTGFTAVYDYLLKKR